MSPRAFVFSLQPKLDLLMRQRDEAHNAFAANQRKLRRAQANEARREREIEEWVQRIRRRHEDLLAHGAVSRKAGALLRLGRDLEALRGLLERRRLRLRQKAGVVRLFQGRHAALSAGLSEVQAKVDAFLRIRSEQLAEHRRQLRRAAEAQRAEHELLRWNRSRPASDRSKA